MQAQQGQPNGVPMTKAQMAGLAGAALLVFGVFTPKMSAPLVGAMNFFRDETVYGYLILAIGIISLFLAWLKQYHYLIWTATSALIVIVAAFINMQVDMSHMEGFRELVQIEWGWVVLGIGTALLYYSWFTEYKSVTPLPPLTDDVPTRGKRKDKAPSLLTEDEEKEIKETLPPSAWP